MSHLRWHMPPFGDGNSSRACSLAPAGSNNLTDPLTRRINAWRLVRSGDLRRISIHFPGLADVRLLICNLLIILFDSLRVMEACWGLGEVETVGGFRVRYPMIDYETGNPMAGAYHPATGGTTREQLRIANVPRPSVKDAEWTRNYHRNRIRIDGLLNCLAHWGTPFGVVPGQTSDHSFC